MRLRAEKSSWERYLDNQHSIHDPRDRFASLPEHLIFNIMSFLPSSDKDDVRILARKWRRMSAHYQPKLLLRGVRLNELEFPYILNEDFNSLEHLSLYKCPGMRNLKLAHLKLETIYLAYCGTLKNVHLNTPNLQTLVFHAPRIRPCVVKFVNCKKLRVLHLVGVAMNMLFTDCNESFPVLKNLTLAGCDESGCINISSNSIQSLSLIRFNKLVGLNIDAPSLVSFSYNGTTVPNFQNINFPGLSIACIELYPIRYQKRDDNWFTRLVEMLRCLKHAERLRIHTTSEKNLIIPTQIRETLAPPLKKMFCIEVETNSRSGSIVDLADSMLWVCPRVSNLLCRSDSWNTELLRRLRLGEDLLLAARMAMAHASVWTSTLQLSHGELAFGQPADLCRFCASPSSRCWRHSVTGFAIEHSREEAQQELRGYLRQNLTTAERDIDWAQLEGIW